MHDSSVEEVGNVCTSSSAISISIVQHFVSLVLATKKIRFQESVLGGANTGKKVFLSPKNNMTDNLIIHDNLYYSMHANLCLYKICMAAYISIRTIRNQNT